MQRRFSNCSSSSDASQGDHHLSQMFQDNSSIDVKVWKDEARGPVSMKAKLVQTGTQGIRGVSPMCFNLTDPENFDCVSIPVWEDPPLHEQQINVSELGCGYDWTVVF